LLLPTRIGHVRAAAMLMLAEAISAQEAYAAGLVSAIFPAETVFEEARAKAVALRHKPQAALATTRKLLRGDRTMVMHCIDEEAELFARAKQSRHAREALQAFLEKREPVFRRDD
jgi:enoyl-CoA hydratase/carnithine racemase